MNHLTEDQLSAFADGALAERERSACEAHLAACEACRTRLAELSALDESLTRALEHDPGEAYFETFADRVAARIARGSPASTGADAPSGATAPSSTKGSPWAWLFTPRGLSLAGSVAAVIAVAGIVLMQNDSFQRMASAPPSPSRERAGTARQMQAPPAAETQGEPGAPIVGAAKKEQSAAEQDRASSTPRDADALAMRASESARAREVKRDEHGEDVPVRGEAAPGRVAPQSSTTSPLQNATPATPYAEMKRRSASPAAPAPATEQEKPSSAPFAQSNEESQAKSGAAKSEPKPSEPTRAQSEGASKNLAKSQKLAAPAPAPSAATSGASDELHVTRTLTGTQGVAPPSLTAVKDGVSPCGTVHDTRGAPISGARVTVANDPLRTTRSGADGRFCLPRLATGDTLSILRVGFQPQRIVVEPATSLAVKLEAIGTLGTDAGMKLGRGAPTALAPPSGAPSPDAYLFRAATPS